jgi:hypothetical protein
MREVEPLLLRVPCGAAHSQELHRSCRDAGGVLHTATFEAIGMLNQVTADVAATAAILQGRPSRSTQAYAGTTEVCVGGWPVTANSQEVEAR